MQNDKRLTSKDLPADFYEHLERANIALAQARETETVTDGLVDIVLHQLMKQACEQSQLVSGKGLSVEQQKREAKSDPRYFKAIAAHAKAQSNRVLAAGRVEQLRMQHEEWRTRSANLRHHL